ncbi:MAG: histone deacetylase [Planctomycetes bacterium]|nr:histone deacetylase [Planctomycetota bacterium]
MLYAYDKIERHHTKEGHPENAGRLAGTLDLLRADGILGRLEEIPVVRAERDLLERVHTPAYLDFVESVVARGGGQLDPDTYACPVSFTAACASAGALLSLLERVMTGTKRRGMSIMRPPGHHALSHQAMGFCIIANVALAARVAREDYGAERVLIVDWDVHHGNGTEAILDEDPTIAFFSTHQYPYYPGTGHLEHIGRGDGEGATVNVPFPAGVGDQGYRRAFEEILVPFAERFDPDLVIVSAGFDAHWRDPLAQERVSLPGFAELQRTVTGIADRHAEGRLLLALEGGYDLEVLPHAILNALRLLEDRPLEDPAAEISDPFGLAPPSAEPDVTALITAARRLHGLD